LRGKAVGRSVALAATWLWVYVGMAVVVLILLLATVPQVPADRLLFEAISALSNVGLSHEVVMIVGPGLDILSAAMLLGRLAPLGILWWMAQTTEKADLAVG
jgi:Trk-type K+ transport system membrane component